MARRRLGVVLPIEGAVGTAVDALRLAVGDPALGRIPAHCTLVPPVHVKDPDLDGALDLVRRSAAGQPGPLRLELGPATSFLPDNPVLHLPVAGAGLAGLRHLRHAVFDGAWKRSARWPFVPHVTLCDDMDEERIPLAVDVLAGWRGEAVVSRVLVLQEGPAPERAWTPIEQAPDGFPLGRG